jgi:uncharacterized damage-inducible protein DinB
MWEEFRLVNGITLRAIQALPKDRIDAHPIPGMRTPKELVAHMATTMRTVIEGVTKGSITADETADSGAALKSHDDMVRYVQDCWKAADKAFHSLTDAHIQAMVKTPWGMDFPGHTCVAIVYDEHLHHRGQLYAYLRALGAEPPFMWDFENSAPEFQPRAVQKA